MALENDDSQEGLVSRPPSLEDVVELCRVLNALGAKYVLVGGFAIRAAGYMRETMDVDLIVAADLDTKPKFSRHWKACPTRR